MISFWKYYSNNNSKTTHNKLLSLWTIMIAADRLSQFQETRTPQFCMPQAKGIAEEGAGFSNQT
jgi:hypothetical protein